MAGAALLAGAGGAAAQDLTNTSAFSNSTTYAGKVLSNTSTIHNNGPAGAWTGDIVSNAGFVTNTGTGAVWTGDVSNDNAVDNENGARWVGDIVWNNNGIRNEAGSSWEGDVLSNGGSNSNTLIDNRGTWIGAVKGNTTRIFTHGGSWTGDVVDNAGNIYNNFADGTLNPGGVNAAVWTGDVLSNRYLILNFALGTWQGDVIDNPGNIANYGNWIGDLTSRGGIINTGIWTGDVINSGALFRAENQIIGALDNRNRVQLTGNLAGITTLTNSGRLELTYTAGAQTLSAASAVFAPTSSYEINITSAGASDRIVVAGNAALAGTVTVVAATGGTPYASPTSYTILSAASISGAFSGVTTDLAFFAPHLSYDATTVQLTVKRNDVGFGDTGATGNQVGVGESVELLLAGNPLYDAVLWLTPEAAQNSFDQLSGQAHASAESWSVEYANLIGGVALNRLQQAYGDLGGSGTASGYAGQPGLDDDPAMGAGFWTQFYGAVGAMAADTDTATLTTTTGGVAIGLDGRLEDWRVGLMLHAGFTSSEVAALGSSIDSTDYGLGLYGGREWGDTRLSLGAVYARHDINSTRKVDFAGFTDVLSGDYAADTAQAFLELSHEFDLGALSLLPYAGLAYARHATDGFTETGGAAALGRADNRVDAAFTTLGIRAEQQFAVGDGMLLAASGSLGWRHGFIDAPEASAALVGGTSFSVVGAPIAGDVVVVGAGLDLDISAATMADLTYGGQFSGETQTHALTASWTTRF